MDIITGEKIQSLCDVFLGSIEDLNYNPNITVNHPKSKLLEELKEEYDNPKIIYCCNTSITILKEKLDLFKNPFVLVSHNSDTNIYNNEYYKELAEHPKIIKWYSQNLMLDHSKTKLLPIGIANSQWSHGNLSLLNEAIINNNNNNNKTNGIYFYCNIDTNKTKRMECYLKLHNYIPFTNRLEESNYFNFLATFKFAICPEGNGIDTHRLWECFYLKVIPIVLENEFILLVKKTYNLPMIILKDWSDLISMRLEYQDYDNSILDFTNLKQEILYIKN